MRFNKWNIPEKAPRIPDELAAVYTPLLAALLSARGFEDLDEAERFLKCGEECLGDPFLLDGMAEAAERLARAIDGREKVAIYGDYDVDGITATCLVTRYLRSRGLDPVLYIPNRIEEGYGLNKCAIKGLGEQGVSLIVTVDCGVTAAAEAEYVASLGMDMVITDHHECSDTLPDAVAVVNPKKPGCGYPLRALAGVGVAFKLICAVHGDTGEMLARYSDFVAVGTIADVMPLVGENRFLVRTGLRKLRTDPNPGLGALLDETGLGKGRVSSAGVGFTLAPRINAAGRLGMVETAVSLLLTEDADEAGLLAKELCGLNRTRRELEARIWQEALDEAGPPPRDRPIVLAREGWHQGVIGIVASRLSDHYGVPAVMISLDGESGKGSCRSCGNWSLFEALTDCAEHLESFGGHAYAAGLTIGSGNVEAFREAFTDYYFSNPPSGGLELCADLEVRSPSMLTLECAESLELLEPFGHGNARPRLALLAAAVDSVVPLAGGRHIRLHIEKFGQTYECVFFSQEYDAFEFRSGDVLDAVFFPQINEYRGRKSVQLLLTDVREAAVYGLCRRALRGDIPEEGAAPERADFARLWKKAAALAKKASGEPPVYADSLYSALRQLGGRGDFLKTAIGLLVLAELGLVSYELRGSELEVCLQSPEKKVNLQESQILRRLRRNNI